MALLQLVLLVLVSMTFAGCEVVEGIFKAGAFIGALGVLLVLGVIAFIVAKIRT